MLCIKICEIIIYKHDIVEVCVFVICFVIFFKCKSISCKLTTDITFNLIYLFLYFKYNLSLKLDLCSLCFSKVTKNENMYTNMYILY